MNVILAVLTVVTNRAYTVGFDEERRHPEKVAYGEPGVAFMIEENR